ncbi:AraC-type DNA-binding protein [Mesorhizobium sp. NFR06]|uniref:helix-turn-helix domain-containing protein n=1 Tax=Mesorhizobium sp. NFR06 TaxID=1566290 RepID=UPI0008E4D1C2|nr:helix-turn-helix transcriptional regulator [Mesorhizobium sp. NFR06]SFP83762.1 AraC-type DNA-binding protein [Mesorhizobium sp. NFR06]
MEGGDQNFSSLHFSTRELAPAKRLPALRELFDRAVRLNIDTDPGRPVEMMMHVAPGLRRATMVSPLTAQVTRPASMLADGEDTVCLMMKTSGHMALAQGRRESVPQVGDGVLLVYRQPVLLQFVDATYLSVRVPFGALAGMADVEASAARLVPRATEALSLLRSYVTNLPDRFAAPQLARLCATHVYDLVALSIGTTKEGREIALRRGVRAARLEAIKASLAQDASLHIDQVAARQCVSPRYIQMLFEEAGTTFSLFVLEQRLAAARHMLTSPRYATWSITEIALEAGFGDISHFNRTFKRRYLKTPTDMRGDGRHDAIPNADLDR